MKISYNWLKWYIPEVPTAEKLADVFTYHLCEVEGVEEKGSDTIFDINILPNRAHDLLSHQGIAKELASLLGIKYIDPKEKYKIPESKPTQLQIKIEPEKCRRYMGRIVRNIKAVPSIDWVKDHLESIGQRSINNIVDAANIVMFDCGQPIHCFDLDKTTGPIVVRMARTGEEITTLDNKNVKLNPSNLIIADDKNVLAIAGVKGGKVAEVDSNTINIIVEVANFDPASVRKTGKETHIFTDALKRFENDLSPSLCDYAMLEMSGLLVEYGYTDFEDIVDVYPKKQEIKTLLFSSSNISKILGLKVSDKELEDILKRYNFDHSKEGFHFKMIVPLMRTDLNIEEDMAEEVARILGYDKVKPKIPKINFVPKVNETYAKIFWARNQLLTDGYSEVITYSFASTGEFELLESASDKKFLRTNLADGLKDSLKLNKINAPLLDSKEINIFEIGNVFLKGKEEIHVAFNEGDIITEMSLDDFCDTLPKSGPKNPKNLTLDNLLTSHSDSRYQPSEHLKDKEQNDIFKMWSLYPFIIRDISVWVPEEVTSEEVKKIIQENVGTLAVRGPELFDEFKKGGHVSYAFRTIFQSYERTLTDTEVNEIMTKITNIINARIGWQTR